MVARTSRCLILVLILVISLGACGRAGPAEPAGTLRFGLSGIPQQVKVGADSGATGYFLDSLIHRGLVTLDDQGELAPGLAREWQQVDPSTYRFTLQAGAKFSDGSAVTSRQVRRTLEYLADPKNAGRTAQAMQGIESIETPDQRTVIIHLKENNSSFLSYLADPTAFIAPDSALEAGGVAEEVGAGPFRIVAESEGVSMTLEPNPDYYDAAKVRLRQLELIFYADGTARSNALISGDVDVIDYVPWEDFDRLRSSKGITVDSQNGLLMDVEFNLTSGPFADPKVRQAVAAALNRDHVVTAVFFGNADPVYGPPLPPDSPYFTDESQRLWSHDPARARQLLAEAGYPDGFSAKLLATSQYTFHQDTALTVQADLQAIGIDVTLDSPDWATRMDRSGSGDYDLKINGWGGVVTDPSYVEAYLGAPDLAKSYGWKNPEIMRQLAVGRRGATDEERQAAYRKAWELIKADVPFVPLARRGQAYAYSDKVSSFHNLPGFLTFYSGYSLAGAEING